MRVRCGSTAATGGGRYATANPPAPKADRPLTSAPSHEQPAGPEQQQRARARLGNRGQVHPDVRARERAAEQRVGVVAAGRRSESRSTPGQGHLREPGGVSGWRWRRAAGQASRRRAPSRARVGRGVRAWAGRGASGGACARRAHVVREHCPEPCPCAPGAWKVRGQPAHKLSITAVFAEFRGNLRAARVRQRRRDKRLRPRTARKWPATRCHAKISVASTYRNVMF